MQWFPDRISKNNALGLNGQDRIDLIDRVVNGLRRGIATGVSIGRPTLIAGLVLAACNTTDSLPLQQHTAAINTQAIATTDMAVATPEAAVLSAGITRIAEVFFRHISLQDMTLDGLNALARLDKDIAFAATDDWVSVSHNGRIFYQIETPGAEEAERWAQVATLALDAARQKSQKLSGVDRELVLETMFDAMTSRLDRFSRYASASNGSKERRMREGFGGVGLAFEHTDGQFIVRSIFPDGPAFHAGLEVGDIISRIDGKEVADLTLTQVRDKLRGRVGSFVMVDVLRGGQSVEDMSLLRERVISNTVVGRIEDNIGIVTIERFNAATEAHVRSAIAVIQHRLGDNLRGVVLDLRNNPGGLLEQAVSVSDLFIKRGRIIRTAGRHPESFQSFSADDLDILNGAPIVVLVNGGSASAAEVVAAALQESGRAVVVGSASYGKGSVQTVPRLPNDGELFVTWSEIFTPDGHGLHDVGILPNICTSQGELRRAGTTGPLLTDVLQRAKPTRMIWHDHLQYENHEVKPNHELVVNIASAGRKACPPNSEAATEDQEIAKLLINSPSLIAEISSGSSSTVASRNTGDSIQSASTTGIIVNQLKQ